MSNIITAWFTREVINPFKYLYSIVYRNIFLALFCFSLLLFINFIITPNILLPINNSHIYLNDVVYEVKNGRLNSLIVKERTSKYKTNRYRINCAYFTDGQSISICENKRNIQILNLKAFAVKTRLIKTSQSPRDIVVESIEIISNNKRQNLTVSRTEIKEWEEKLLLPIYILRIIWSAIYIFLFYIIFKKMTLNRSK